MKQLLGKINRNNVNPLEDVGSSQPEGAVQIPLNTGETSNAQAETSVPTGQAEGM